MEPGKISNRMEIVGHDELSKVQGGGLKSWIKKAYRWAKKHLTGTRKSIAIKGEHDIGGGGE